MRAPLRLAGGPGRNGRLLASAVMVLLLPGLATRVQAAVNLVASKTVADDNGGSPRPGETLTYSLTVSNTGTTAATSVVLSDPIPPAPPICRGPSPRAIRPTSSSRATRCRSRPGPWPPPAAA